MPWSEFDFPNSMKNLNPKIRSKAISIANAILENGGSEGTAIATGIKRAKKMGLVKMASIGSSVVDWTKKHPLMASGIALTGGIGAADAITSSIETHGEPRGKSALKGLGRGLVYGAALSAVEPLILHKGLKAPVHSLV